MKYYLINNTIKKGVEMPNSLVYDHPNQYNGAFNQWLSSLQPCEISESEMDKVITHLQKIDAVGWTTQIDVTDIVSAQVICNTDRCDGECIECTNMVLKVKFKQPTEKQVDEYGYIKCGDCNKFYLCANCGAQCGSDGHFIEPNQLGSVYCEDPKEVGLCYDTLFNNFSDFYRENKMDSILTNNKEQKIFEWFLDNFERPKQVDGEIEAVEFAEWIHINAQPRLPNKNQWKMYNNSVVITTQELYEIFKNRK